jgi:hypothetical protein
MLLEAGWRHVLASPLLLHIAVGQRLLGVHSDVGHVARRHVALGHPRPALLGRQVGARGLFGGVDGISVVHAVIPSRGLGGVQAGLEMMSVKARG